MTNSLSLLIITTRFDKPEKALYAALARSGMHVDMICEPEASGTSELMDAGISLSHLKIRGRMDLRAIRFIGGHLKQRPFDIIYAPRNNALSNALIAARDEKIKILGYRGTSGHISKWNPGDWFTYLNPGVDRIVCVSEAVRQYLMTRHIPEERLVTIHKGHDVGWYDNDCPRKDLSGWGIPPGAFVVGFVGNMRTVKGIDVLIRSRKRISDRNVHYLLIGDIRDKSLPRLVKKEKASEYIHFTEFRDDAQSLMKTFSAFVMPSVEREGFPKALVEAMSQCIPSIATRVGGMPEIVQHNRNGLLIPPKDPEALAAAITFLINNPEKARLIGETARQTIIDDFNVERTVTQMMQLFNRLLQ